MFLKTKQLEKKARKIDSLTRSKFNSIKNIRSKALIDSDTSHEEFALVINEE